MKRKLPSITLIGIDCVNVERLELAMEICQKDFEFGAVKLLTSLPTECPYAIQIPAIKSIEAYSEFCIAKLADFVDTEHALIVQYDGFILNPNAWTDEFLKYDYIGAPWLIDEEAVKNFKFKKEQIGTWLVGNGGFCLRSKRFLDLCVKLAKEGEFTEYQPEDTVLCVGKREILENAGMQFAPIPLAKQFSYESINEEENKWTDQFGFHGLQWTDISKWLKEHPEYPIQNKIVYKNYIEKQVDLTK